MILNLIKLTMRTDHPTLCQLDIVTFKLYAFIPSLKGSYFSYKGEFIKNHSSLNAIQKPRSNLSGTQDNPLIMSPHKIKKVPNF